MKKILLTIFICFFVIIQCYCKNSFAEYFSKDIRIGGYKDYPPLGYIKKDTEPAENQNPNEKKQGDKLYSLLSPIIDALQTEMRNNVYYKLYDMSDSAQIAKDIEEGKIDIFIGAYNKTKHFENLHFIYPAMINNPITIFVLPSRINEIKNLENINTMKGVRSSKEVFSDFVEENLSSYNITKVDSSREMFEMLITQKVDYVLSSYYYGTIEAIKLGVRHQIATSSKHLWNIPIFVGIPMLSPQRDVILRRIDRFFSDKKIIETIKENLKNILRDFEQEYKGVIAPNFNTQ